MPVRNLTRTFVPESFYHVYNRGINKADIFKDKSDYIFFLRLFDRHLSPEPVTDRISRQYKWLHKDIELNCFCLMPNHFHLLVYQVDEKALASLMLCVGTAYTMYFNKKYKRRGPLFESTYKASLVSSDAYLMHITRYIHLNPPNYKTWPHSSYLGFLGKGKDNCHILKPKRILELFDSKAEYEEFVNDYEGFKKSLSLIKTELADA